MMKFTETTTKENVIVIDGYSTAKTLKGIISDIAKEVEKHNPQQAKYLKDNDMSEILNQRFEYCNFWIDVEEVGCATRVIENDEVECAEANYYIAVSFERE